MDAPTAKLSTYSWLSTSPLVVRAFQVMVGSLLMASSAWRLRVPQAFSASANCYASLGLLAVILTLNHSHAEGA